MNRISNIVCFVFAIAVLAVLNLNCKHNIVLPPPNSPDTTNHEIEWIKSSLGNGDIGTFRDVAIVREDPLLLYAVGEIYRKDDQGSLESTPYGLGIFDGNVWTLKHIYANYPNSRTPIRPTGIVAFSPVDVWLAWGDVFRWDGCGDDLTLYGLTVEATTPSPILGAGQGISRLWGISSQSLYGVGTNGAFAYYNGRVWKKIETGVGLPFQDIWGNENEVLAVASRVDIDNGRKVLKLTNSAAAAISDSGLPWSITGVWFEPGKTYYIVGDGIFTAHNARPGRWNALPNSVTTHFAERIKGNAANDVFICGAYGELLHWNGATWRSYIEQTGLPNGSFSGLAVTKQLVVVVGGDGSRPTVMIGRR